MHHHKHKLKVGETTLWWISFKCIICNKLYTINRISYDVLTLGAKSGRVFKASQSPKGVVFVI